MGIGFKDYTDDALQPREEDETCVCCDQPGKLDCDFMCVTCLEERDEDLEELLEEVA